MQVLQRFFSSDFLRSYCTVNMEIMSKSRSPYNTMDYGSIHLMAVNCGWRNITKNEMLFHTIFEEYHSYSCIFMIAFTCTDDYFYVKRRCI